MGSIFSDVHHMAMVVSNMEKSLSFYRDLLGFNLLFEERIPGEVAQKITGLPIQEIKIALLQLGNSNIELIQYNPPGREIPKDIMPSDIINTHIAISVPDIEEAHRRLKDMGVSLASTSPHVITEAESKQFAGHKILFFQDPDGHTLELMELPR